MLVEEAKIQVGSGDVGEVGVEIKEKDDTCCGLSKADRQYCWDEFK